MHGEEKQHEGRRVEDTTGGEFEKLSGERKREGGRRRKGVNGDDIREHIK